MKKGKDLSKKGCTLFHSREICQLQSLLAYCWHVETRVKKGKDLSEKRVRAIPLERFASFKARYCWCPGMERQCALRLRYASPYISIPLYSSVLLLFNDSITNKRLWKLTPTIHSMHSFTNTPTPPHLALRPPFLYAQTASLEEFEHIPKLLPGQTWVYSRGCTYAWNKSATHSYTMLTVDTLSAIQRDTAQMRLPFKYSILTEGARDVPNFILLERGAALALRISKFIIGIYPIWWIQHCCTRPVEYAHS